MRFTYEDVQGWSTPLLVERLRTVAANVSAPNAAVLMDEAADRLGRITAELDEVQGALRALKEQ